MGWESVRHRSMHGKLRHVVQLGLSDKMKMEKKFSQERREFRRFAGSTKIFIFLPMPMAGYLLSTHEVQL